MQISSYDWLKTGKGGKGGADAQRDAATEEASKTPRELPHNWKRGNLPLTGKSDLFYRFMTRLDKRARKQL